MEVQEPELQEVIEVAVFELGVFQDLARVLGYEELVVVQVVDLHFGVRSPDNACPAVVHVLEDGGFLAGQHLFQHVSVDREPDGVAVIVHAIARSDYWLPRSKNFRLRGQQSCILMEAVHRHLADESHERLLQRGDWDFAGWLDRLIALLHLNLI